MTDTLTGLLSQLEQRVPTPALRKDVKAINASAGSMSKSSKGSERTRALKEVLKGVRDLRANLESHKKMRRAEREALLLRCRDLLKEVYHAHRVSKAENAAQLADEDLYFLYAQGQPGDEVLFKQQIGDDPLRRKVWTKLQIRELEQTRRRYLREYHNCLERFHRRQASEGDEEKLEETLARLDELEREQMTLEYRLSDQPLDSRLDSLRRLEHKVDEILARVQDQHKRNEESGGGNV